jgi:DNA-binding IclR family transcriptional regulator
MSQGVPAVLHTMSIFEFLRERGNEPATMTEIAKALEMNPSTCFNILKTLQDGELLTCDPTSKRYRLGHGLLELGAVVSEEGAVLTTARMRALEFVRRNKLIVLLCQKADDDSFIVIDKLRGRPDPRGTAPLGGRVPPNGAVLAKAYYAWADVEEVNRMLDLHGLPARTPTSVTHVEQFRQELRKVRERGYSISLGEYERDYNAVGTAVLGPSGRPVLIMVVTGHTSFMPSSVIPAIGERLSCVAEDVSKAVSHLPSASKEPLERLRRRNSHESRTRVPRRLQTERERAIAT